MQNDECRMRKGEVGRKAKGKWQKAEGKSEEPGLR